MARKRFILFRVLQSFLNKTWLLGLITAIFCAISSPRTFSAIPTVFAPNQSLIQQSKTLYDTGQYNQAIEILKQAIKEFASRGDFTNQALALSNLSLAYQQLSNWEEATKAIAESLQLLQDPALEGRSQALAQVLDIQGRLQFSTGQNQQALDNWQQSRAIYQQLGDISGALKSRINSVQALRSLGLFNRALGELTEIDKTLTSTPDSVTKAVGLRSFGDVLQLVGDFERSRQVLQQSLLVAQNLNSPENISGALFSLGNTFRAQQDTKEALKFYQQAALTATPTLKLQSQLNQLSLLIDLEEVTAAQKLLPQIETQLKQLPSGRATVYAQINFAQSLKRLKDVANPPKIAELLAASIKQARSLQDPRLEAYALGSLGQLYEQNQQVTEAKNLTEQSLLIAQSI